MWLSIEHCAPTLDYKSSCLAFSKETSIVIILFPPPPSSHLQAALPQSPLLPKWSANNGHHHAVTYDLCIPFHQLHTVHESLMWLLLYRGLHVPIHVVYKTMWNSWAKKNEKYTCYIVQTVQLTGHKTWQNVSRWVKLIILHLGRVVDQSKCLLLGWVWFQWVWGGDGWLEECSRFDTRPCTCPHRLLPPPAGRYTVHILPVEYDILHNNTSGPRPHFLIIQSLVTVGVNYNIFHSLT